MKSIFFGIIVFAQLVLITCLKLLDNLLVIAAIFATCMTIGFFLMYLGDTVNTIWRNLGWGLRYGTLFSIIATVAFVYWLSYRL